MLTPKEEAIFAELLAQENGEVKANSAIRVPNALPEEHKQKEIPQSYQAQPAIGIEDNRDPLIEKMNEIEREVIRMEQFHRNLEEVQKKHEKIQNAKTEMIKRTREFQEKLRQLSISQQVNSELKSRLQKGIYYYQRIDTIRKELSPEIKDLLFLPLSTNQDEEPALYLKSLLDDLHECVVFFQLNKEYKDSSFFSTQYEYLEQRVLQRTSKYYELVFKEHSQKQDYVLLIMEESNQREVYTLLQNLYSRKETQKGILCPQNSELLSYIIRKADESEGYLQLKSEVLKHFINSRLPLAQRLAQIAFLEFSHDHTALPAWINEVMIFLEELLTKECAFHKVLFPSQRVQIELYLEIEDTIYSPLKLRLLGFQNPSLEELMLGSSLLEERFSVRVASLTDSAQSNPQSEIVESQCSSRSEMSEYTEKRKTSRNLVKRILRLLQEMLVSLIKLKLNQIARENEIIIPHFKNAPLQGARRTSTTNVAARALLSQEEEDQDQAEEKKQDDLEEEEEKEEELDREEEEKKFQTPGISALVTQGCGVIAHVERSLSSSAIKEVRNTFAQTAVGALLEGLKMEKDVKEGLGFLSKLGMRRFKSINENKDQIQEELQVLWVMHNLASIRSSLDSSERAPLFSGTRSS